MKKPFLIIFSSLLAFIHAIAQPFMAVEEPSDSMLNVVAYFAKNDTMTYVYSTTKYAIADKDTTTSNSYSEEFMLTVHDTLKDGYRLELIPLSFTVKDHIKNDFTTALTKKIWELTKAVHVVFTTDETGTLKRIENWRKLKDLYKKGLHDGMDSQYNACPGLDSILPRTRLDSYISMNYAQEEGIRAEFSQLQLLFNLHGHAVPMGITESDDDSQDYPTHTKITAGYGKYDEFGTDDDYNVFASTVTTIPKEDTKDMVSGVIGMFYQGNVVEEADKLLTGEANEGITITNLEDYYYFFNGWPSLMRKQNRTEILNQQRITEERIEWTERSWQASTEIDDTSSAL